MPGTIPQARVWYNSARAPHNSLVQYHGTKPAATPEVFPISLSVVMMFMTNDVDVDDDCDDDDDDDDDDFDEEYDAGDDDDDGDDKR